MANQPSAPSPWITWDFQALSAARRALPESLRELPEGENQDLLCRVIDKVAQALGRNPDMDVLLEEDLRPFDLAESLLRVSANDGSEGFMGPSYQMYEIFRMSDGKIAAVDDRIETRAYSLLGEAASLEEACALVGENALENLGGGDEVIFEGFGTVVPSEIGPDRPGFWVRFLLKNRLPTNQDH